MDCGVVVGSALVWRKMELFVITVSVFERFVIERSCLFSMQVGMLS